MSPPHSEHTNSDSVFAFSNGWGIFPRRISDLPSIAMSLLAVPKRATANPRPATIQPTPWTISQLFAACCASRISCAVEGVGATPRYSTEEPTARNPKKASIAPNFTRSNIVIRIALGWNSVFAAGEIVQEHLLGWSLGNRLNPAIARLRDSIPRILSFPPVAPPSPHKCVEPRSLATGAWVPYSAQPGPKSSPTNQPHSSHFISR